MKNTVAEAASVVRSQKMEGQEWEEDLWVLYILIFYKIVFSPTLLF